jgi:C1A family cysteine protease
MVPVKSRLPHSSRYYGWQRQQPDRRDARFHPAPSVLESLPAAGDLAPGMGPVLDQGPIGSCGPNSADSLILFDQQKQGLPVKSSSRLHTYYFTRQLMGTVDQDSGVDNRTMLKCLNQYGFCDESLWPYDVGQFTHKPAAQAIQAAAGSLVQSYAAVMQTLDVMRGCIASGFPFLFGFSVYESFESAEVTHTGMVPMPRWGERSVGGHDCVICGYDDSKQLFKFKNSWGGSWGHQGYGYFPYAYATDPNLSSDFWVINAIPGGGTPAPGPTPTPTPTPVKSLFTMSFGRPVPKGGRVTFSAPVPIPAGTYEVAARGQQATEDGDGADREFHADARE